MIGWFPLGGSLPIRILKQLTAANATAEHSYDFCMKDVSGGWAVRREFEAHHDRFSSCWIAGQNSHLTALNSWIIHPGQLTGFTTMVRASTAPMSGHRHIVLA